MAAHVISEALDEGLFVPLQPVMLFLHLDINLSIVKPPDAAVGLGSFGGVGLGVLHVKVNFLVVHLERDNELTDLVLGVRYALRFESQGFRVFDGKVRKLDQGCGLYLGLDLGKRYL